MAILAHCSLRKEERMNKQSNLKTNQDGPELRVLTDIELDQVSGGRKLVKHPGPDQHPGPGTGQEFGQGHHLP